jgi:flagellar biosynthesis protein FlhA
VVPKIVTIAVFQKVLQNLLAEGVHIRDLRTVLETIADVGGRTQDTMDLTASVRASLGAAIIQQIYGYAQELPVIVLEPELERVIANALGRNANEPLGLEPNLADALVRNATTVTERQEQQGQPAALLVPDVIRVPMSRLLRRLAPRLRVIAHGEIPETHSIRVSSVLGANS